MFGYPKNDASPSAVNFLRKLYQVKGIEKHFRGDRGPSLRLRRRHREDADQGGPQVPPSAPATGNVGIIVGEIGWASNGPSSAEEVVGAKGQAEPAQEGPEHARQQAQGVEHRGNAFVYVWRDFPAGVHGVPWCPKAGLLKENGSSKPGLRAVRGVIRSSR